MGCQVQQGDVERLNRTAYVVRFTPTDNPVPGITAILDVPLTAGITRAQLLDLVRRYLAELARTIDVTCVREGLL